MTTDGEIWGYRPHLDGMRTIAIYLVVLFHAGLATFVGGFIGVDVFFVLSGFLVTNVMLSEHTRAGAVRLRRFYARRVRRLLPAAVVTIVAVCGLTVLVEPRLARIGFIDDARSALLYVGNWHFLGAATDYFADDVNKSPFLHFWSLAIEEQFYVVYPLLLVGLLALARRLRRPVVVAGGLGSLLVASLIVQVLVARHDPLRAYYGTDARLYQLLAGALLAVMWPKRRVVATAIVRWAGVFAAAAVAAIVLVATDVVDLSPSTRGIAATALCVVVIASLELSPRSPVPRVLATAPMTYLGRISYGTYLWHWPLIVLAKPVLDLGPLQTAVLAGVGATALSALSFQLLETPIRKAAVLAPRPRQVVAVGLAISVVVAVFAVPAVLESNRKPALAQRTVVTPAVDDVSPGGSASTSIALARLLRSDAPAVIDVKSTELPPVDLSTCSPTNPAGCTLHTGSRFHVVLLGDSNAEMLIPAFVELAGRYDFTLSVLFRPGCPWQEGLVWGAHDQALIDQCVSSRDGWYATTIPALHPDVVVAVNVTRDPGSRPDAFFEPGDGALGSRTLDEVVSAATASSLGDLTATGARVLLLEPIPYADFDPTQCLSGAHTMADCAYVAPTEPYPTEKIYREQDQQRDDVFDADIDRLACPYLPTCVPFDEGQLVFRNEFHLSNQWIMDHVEQLWTMMDSTAVFDGLG